MAALGLLPALDEAGIRTRELIYTNRFDQVVWRELRGADAGYEVPQISIHRGKLLGVLLRTVLKRLGPSRLHVDHRMVNLQERHGRITAIFERCRTAECREVVGDGLIGADGIHSRVRSIFYPDEGPPRWSGGPEGVIDLVESRAPEGFTDVDAIASFAERETIVRGYASMAGYSREQVNRGVAVRQAPRR